jgi:peptide/nickel transport system permease protein
MPSPLPGKPSIADLLEWNRLVGDRLDASEIRRRVDGYLRSLDSTDSNLQAEAFARLSECGGLALPDLMTKLLASTPPTKQRASAFLVRCGGRRDEYRLGTSPEQMALEDARIERWWARNRNHYESRPEGESTVMLRLRETRFGHWIRQLVHGELGESTSFRRPVMALLKESLPKTLLIQIPALILMLLVGVPLGVWSAIRRDTMAERGVGYFTLLLSATPRFLGGTFLILLFGQLLPVAGLRDPEIMHRIESGALSAWSLEAVGDLATRMLLPVIVLAYGGVVLITRHVRSSMTEVLCSDPILFARVRGVSERSLLYRHALRLGLLPLVTLLGVMVPGLIGGSVIVEQLFSIRGTGMLMWRAAMEQDIPLAMALVTLLAVVTLTCYALQDLALRVLDPRVRTP